MARVQHGQGATRWLADRAGVDIRQAQRWYRGEGTPGHKAASAFPGIIEEMRRAYVAAQLRTVRQVRVGTLAVRALSSGKPDGKRRPPDVLDVAGIMDQVAAAWEAGRDRQAQDLFDGAVINAYAGEPLGDDSGLASMLGITDYEAGVTVVD